MFLFKRNRSDNPSPGKAEDLEEADNLSVNKPRGSSETLLEDNAHKTDNCIILDKVEDIKVEYSVLESSFLYKAEDPSISGPTDFPSLVVSIAERVEENHIEEGSIICRKSFEMDECFEIIEEAEVAEAKPKSLEVFDKALEDAISRLQEVTNISEKDVQEITYEIRHLGNSLNENLRCL